MKAWRIKLSEEEIRQRLEMLERWKASGLPKKAWAQAQGVDTDTFLTAANPSTLTFAGEDCPASLARQRAS
jgi:hypothetical protein